MRSSTGLVLVLAMAAGGASELRGKDKAAIKWLTGTVTEVSQDYDQTGWSHSPDGTSSSRKGVHYADYSIQAQDVVYTLRLMPTTKSRAIAWAAGWAYEQSSPNISLSAGDHVKMVIQGTSARLEIEGRIYSCSVIRQVLISGVPHPTGESSAVPADSAASKDSQTSSEPRPTLRREE